MCSAVYFLGLSVNFFCEHFSSSSRMVVCGTSPFPGLGGSGRGMIFFVFPDCSNFSGLRQMVYIFITFLGWLVEFELSTNPEFVQGAQFPC